MGNFLFKTSPEEKKRMAQEEARLALLEKNVLTLGQCMAEIAPIIVLIKTDPNFPDLPLKAAQALLKADASMEILASSGMDPKAKLRAFTDITRVSRELENFCRMAVTIAY